MLILIMIINIAAVLLNVFGSTLLDINLPNNTPIKLEKIRALAADINTITGDPVSAVNNKVAICVLSPNSARNTAVNVVRTVT